MRKARSNLLVVDDDLAMRQMLASLFRKEGFEVEEAASADEAVERCRDTDFQVVLSDIKMPGRSGIELVGEIRNIRPGTPVVLMTAYASVPTAVEAMKLGAFDYIQKPFNPEEVGILIERAVRERRLLRENEVMRRTIEDLDSNRMLIGEAPAMRPVLEKIERVAQSSATVLITGESGTGKELIAREIHTASPRAAARTASARSAGPTSLSR